jgi:hypothetical protein
LNSTGSKSAKKKKKKKKKKKRREWGVWLPHAARPFEFFETFEFNWLLDAEACRPDAGRLGRCNNPPCVCSRPGLGHHLGRALGARQAGRAGCRCWCGWC